MLVKKSTIIELSLKGTGSVNICTLTNEPFDYQINSKLNFLWFGIQYDDENDEL